MARQRRHNRRRKAGGRFRGLYLFLCVLLVLGALFLACIVFFRVQIIQAEGFHRYTQEEIIQASGVAVGDDLLFLDQYQIQRRIRSQLPYVDSVRLQRVFPDRVVITVVECVPAAALSEGDHWWLVNSSGKLLESVSQPPAGCPVIDGITALTPAAGIRVLVSEEEQTRWNCALSLLTALEKREQLLRLSRLDCAAGVLTARYDGTYTLLLPTTIKYAHVDVDQFTHFLNVLDDILDRQEEGGADLVDFTLWESTGNIYTRQSK